MTDAKVVRKKLADFVQNDANPVRHNPRNLGVVVDSIRKVGAFRSGAASKGKILAGNLTWEAMAEAGIEDVVEITTDGKTWVIVNREDLTPEQERYYAYADERSSELAEWDTEQIAADLEAGLSFEGMFTPEELTGVLQDALREPVEVPEPQIDHAEELREKWQTARGQVWVIPSATVKGKAHRLMCGDSTNAADVARLMGGEKAAITLTDPPYNVGINYGKEQTDNKADYAAFNRAWFGLCPSDGTVLTSGIINLALWYREIAPPRWLCSWRKVNQCSNSGLGGFNTWEPLLVFGKIAKHVAHDSWDIPVVQENVAHPVPKTVEAWSAFVDAFTDRGALLYDPFLGSGTTMCAAETLGRACYAMEIEPKYVAVALERLAGMGLEPRLAES